MSTGVDQVVPGEMGSAWIIPSFEKVISQFSFRSRYSGRQSA